MDDKELAIEIERGELVITAANPQHRYVPLEIKDQIIAALRRGHERQPCPHCGFPNRQLRGRASGEY